MKSNTLLRIILIISINFLFTISYAQMKRTSSFNITEINVLRSEIPRALTIKTSDGNLRKMSRCDFIVLNPDAAHVDPETISQWNNLHRSDILTIPVEFHIIQKTDHTGYIEQDKIVAQISALNDAYVSLNIQFQLVGTDSTKNDDWFGINCGNFTDEIACGTHPTHCSWSTSKLKCEENNTFEPTYKEALAANPSTTLNIYTAELGGTLGYAYLPTDIVSYNLPLYMDGVVLHYSTLQSINDNDSHFNEGDTGVHEVGHYLGLHHTFNGGCGGGPTGGDEVTDTAEQDDGDNIFICVEADTCPNDGLGNDPIHNYMNYVPDVCMYEFTEGQKDRMLGMINDYRAELGSELSLFNTQVPEEFSIQSIYPNPFNPSTTISFSIPEFALTSIIAYDITGRELETLINKELNIGNYFINWNASSYPSGVYLIRMESGEFIQVQKALLIK